MTTLAYCKQCDWEQKFDEYAKAKHAAKVHLHGDAHIKQVDE